MNWTSLVNTVRPHHLLLAAVLLVYPWIASPFWNVQVGAQTFLLGIVALSLMFLAGYGGVVSLAQMSVAGVAGYMIAILGVNSANLGLGWPWWAVIPLAIASAVIVATLIGAISVRTEGIYTIMITLALAVAFFYFVRQNYAVFNGFTGFAGIKPPSFAGIDWRAPVPFYYSCLGVAVLCYFAVLYLGRSTFGITLQAIRDNPRRMSALGYHIEAHRIIAYSLAGLMAALGGVLLVWFNGRIDPGTVGIGPVIDILIIAVLGGLRHPIGPFLGAFVFIMLDNFAIDFIAPERFNTLIGLIFLAVVLFSPDGLLGVWQWVKLKLTVHGRTFSTDRSFVRRKTD